MGGGLNQTVSRTGNSDAVRHHALESARQRGPVRDGENKGRQQQNQPGRQGGNRVSQPERYIEVNVSDGGNGSRWRWLSLAR